MRMLPYWLVLLFCCSGLLPHLSWAASLEVTPPVERPQQKRKAVKRWRLKQKRQFKKRRLRQLARPKTADTIWIIFGILITILCFAVPLSLVLTTGINVLVRGLMFINAVLWTGMVLIPLLTKPPSERKFLYLTATTILLSIMMSAAFLLGSIWLLLGVFIGLLGLLVLMIFALSKIFGLNQPLENPSEDSTRAVE